MTWVNLRSWASIDPLPTFVSTNMKTNIEFILKKFSNLRFSDCLVFWLQSVYSSIKYNSVLQFYKIVTTPFLQWNLLSLQICSVQSHKFSKSISLNIWNNHFLYFQDQFMLKPLCYFTITHTSKLKYEKYLCYVQCMHSYSAISCNIILNCW